MSVTLHQRQWVISNSAAPPQLSGVEHFHTAAIGSGKYLHHDPQLRISKSSDQLVVGTAINSGSSDGASNLCGRFVTISFPWLSLDASGLMGVYYFDDIGKDAICSSSQALLAEGSGPRVDGRRLKWQAGMNWDPIPTSRVPGARKLYCDQVFSLETRTVAQRPRSLNTISESKAVEGLSYYFIALAGDIGKRNVSLFLPLTAGRDSRTLLSALLAAGTRFEAFTWVFDKGSAEDAGVAERLCRKYGVKHHKVNKVPSDPEALSKYLLHTSACFDDADAHHLIPGGYYRLFPRGSILLTGGLFEIGRRFYERQFSPPEAAASPEGAADNIAHSFKEGNSAIVKRSIAEWIRYRVENPIKGLDLTDAFYLDQRIGGWRSSLCQGEDSLDPDFLNLANSWNCIELLMSTSPERRAAGVIQTCVMEQLVPGISRAKAFNATSLRARLRARIVGTRFESIARRLIRFSSRSLAERL